MTKTVMLQPGESHRLMEIKAEDEEFDREICAELKVALEAIREKSKAHEEKQKEQIRVLLEKTSLADAKPEDITFDTRYYGMHEVVYAREEKKPDLASILDMIFSGKNAEMKKHGINPGSKFEDFEIVEDPDIQSSWNAQKADA